jgi:hypothetical protein
VACRCGPGRWGIGKVPGIERARIERERCVAVAAAAFVELGDDRADSQEQIAQDVKVRKWERAELTAIERDESSMLPALEHTRPFQDVQATPEEDRFSIDDVVVATPGRWADPDLDPRGKTSTVGTHRQSAPPGYPSGPSLFNRRRPRRAGRRASTDVIFERDRRLVRPSP